MHQTLWEGHIPVLGCSSMPGARATSLLDRDVNSCVAQYMRSYTSLNTAVDAIARAKHGI